MIPRERGCTVMAARYMDLNNPLEIRGWKFKTRHFDEIACEYVWDLNDFAFPERGFLRRAVPCFSEEDIQKIIGIFTREGEKAVSEGSRILALEAGYDTVLGNFISPRTNKRTDMWGGELDNRMRLPLIILSRIRKIAGKKALIAFHMSGAEFVSNGYEIREGVKIARKVQKINLPLHPPTCTCFMEVISDWRQK